MKLLSKSLTIVAISALVVFTGCTKKPIRPDPSATVMGGNNGGALDPSAMSAGDVPAGMEQRGADGVIDDGKTIRGLLQPVYFDYDKSAIRQSEREKIAAAADYLKKNPGYRILFEGRCDWRGTAEYNLGLGDRRANSVKSFIKTLGITDKDIETLSKGDLEAQENAAEDIMSKDRRVELVLIKPVQ